MIGRDRMDLFDPKELDKPATQAGYREAFNAQLASVLLMEMREAAGLSRERLAQLLGKSEDEIELLERGSPPEGPTMGFVLRVAEVCGARLRVRFVKDPARDHDIGGL